MSTPPPHGRSRIAALAVVLAAAGALTLTACGDDSGGSSSATPTAPDTASFSGDGASALASLKASVRAEASERSASASAAASSFEASVSAETERAGKAARAELAKVDGQGNAMSEVTMSGKPRSETGGLLAVVVTITNKSGGTASYAVQVDFLDSSGKVVETRYVGAEDLKAGEKAQPVAVSRKPAEPVLTPKLAKAQRY
ncbi:hypothetical protein M2161_008216 [Streptomyces sp. SAI-133]|uniref:FxLYD domain-containing protein n=1 Tax=unclassified Streptomyces TaxID=2593676 RepID=UPI002474FCFE|nr:MULTISPECIES: FxLYD domain-containing protein [unclassified Streptomyces]MDH6546867.1 hypothetical protein [Streptomyces sp. SAI-041]MDH6589110.1 hypothetical protein [Streptomyces sp. SAI-133]